MNVVKLTLNHLCVATTFMHSLPTAHVGVLWSRKLPTKYQ